MNTISSKLAGKTALVTGASKGIGAAIARNLAAAGAKVIVNYASSKSGAESTVAAITRSLSKELGPKKIRVNSLNPGMVETEGFISSGFEGSDFQKKVIAETPLGRIGYPDDIGRVAVFLASEDSGWVTGQTLYASGGSL